MGKASRIAALISIEIEIKCMETMYAFLDCNDVVAHLIMGMVQIDSLDGRELGPIISE